MALCHKWDVKNDFVYVLQFFSLISDGLGSVSVLRTFLFVCFSEDKPPFKISLEECSTCISRSAWEDWCRDIETSKDHFFVMVAAYESYDNAVLKITGGNIKNIKQTDNDKGCKTFKP